MADTVAGTGWPLGPGTLKVGATGSAIDISCLINNATISANKSQDDNVTKLCGTVVPGAVTYDYVIGGNVDIDIAEASGFFALSQDNPGSQQAFEYVPNSDAGTSAAGTLILDPLDFGGSDTTQTMAVDFEMALVGQPTYTYGDVVPLDHGTQLDDSSLVDA